MTSQVHEGKGECLGYEPKVMSFMEFKDKFLSIGTNSMTIILVLHGVINIDKYISWLGKVPLESQRFLTLYINLLTGAWS